MLRSTIAGVLAAAATLASAANVSVAFVEPSKFTDAGYSRAFATDKDRLEVQREIEQHLRRLGERHLAPNDSLDVEVLDIDLAGHFEPFRFRGNEVRIVRDVTWPRMKLRYTLTRDGRVIASAEEHVSNMNHFVSGHRYSSADRLRYEKTMLDDWFERRVIKR